MGKAFEAHCKSGSGGRALLQLLATGGGQSQGETAAIFRIVRSLDKPRADQRLDRPADGGSAAPHPLGDGVESRGLGGSDGLEQLAAAALSALGRPIGYPILGDRNEAAGKRLWR
jgi:hypothetical protein